MLVARAVPFLASFALLASVAPSAAAAAETETRIGIVSTQGLDLATSAGRAALDARIRREVRELCGESTTREELAELVAIRQCRVKALNDVAPQVAALEQAAATAQAATAPKVSASMN